MQKAIKAALAAALAAITLTAYADDKPGKAPFHSNGILDNAFVSAGAGVNAVLDNGAFNVGGPAVRIDAGKWLTPYTAVRLGWQGVTNRSASSANGWFSGEDPFGFHYVHADWMVDATSAILGYRAGRTVSARPFARAGLLLTSYDGRTDGELAAGAGLDVAVRITPRLSIELEAASTWAREEAYRGAGKVVAFPSATAGVAIAIGRTDFERHADTVREVTVEAVADCGHEAVIAALRDEIARLKAQPADTVTVERWLDNQMVVYFTIDRWNLSVRENWHLKDLVDVLPEDAVLTVTGHADKETGSAARNDYLSRKRAATVEAALRDLGFKGTVDAAAKGDTDNPFEGNPPKNRCATIRVSLGR